MKTTRLLAITGIVGAIAFWGAQPENFAQTRTTPAFDVDPFWPKLPEKFFLGPVRGLSINAEDHIWIVQDSSGLGADIRGAAANPPQADCCMPAPPVLEFDAAGNYIRGWGGPGEGYEWPQQIHGVFVDHKNNVWVASERQGENHLIKFDRSGKFLLQIGRRGQGMGSNDTQNVGGAADMFVYPKTNELFVADGYINRRVVVFDADSGAYKRHWGAYGNKPDDAVRPTRTTEGPGAQQFNLVHHVVVANDDTVYVADRNNNRIQVFSLDGKFVKEMFVARTTSTSNGTVYSLAFSRDPQQQFLYVADAGNGHIRILNRQTLAEVGMFGRWGRQPGQFMVPHNIATDSKGNLYVAEIREGNVQKFVLKGN